MTLPFCLIIPDIDITVMSISLCINVIECLKPLSMRMDR